MYEAHLII